MKLNDFQNKAPIVTKRSARTVINVNNDQMERKYLERIATLDKQIQELQNDLYEATPFIDLYNDTLRKYDQTIANLEKAEQQLTSSQMALDNNATKLKELDHLQSELQIKESHINTINQEKQQISTQNNEVLRINNDLQTEKTELKELVNEQGQFIIQLNTQMQELNSHKEQLTTNNQTLLRELTPLRHEYPELKKEYYSSQRQLGVEQERNKAAIAKIEELEYLKLQLNDWTKNLEGEIKDTDSKKSAYQKTLKKKDKILAEVTKEVSELLQDREELQLLVQYYKEETLKPRYGGGFGEVREAQIPLARDAVKRQYLGLGKPTLLKFKREDKNDNEE